MTIIERNRCGGATSAGNVGWITPAISTPLAAPGVMAKVLRWMWRSDSPFLLRPRCEPMLWRWCWRFWRACEPRRFRAGMNALVALNRRTFELFDRLAADGVAFEMHRRGLVMAALGAPALAATARELEELSRAGQAIDAVRLDARALRALEPAMGERVIGGFHARSERHVRPESLMAGLRDHANRSGVTIVEDTVAAAVQPDQQGWLVRCGERTVVADRVVLAAGVWSAELLASLQAPLLLEAAKGYSITSVGEGLPPRHALYLLEAHVGCSPFDGVLRLGGTLELAGRDLSIRRRRIDAVAAAATAYLDTWRPSAERVEWAGLRPVAPDGLPWIGPLPGRDGVYVATGHAMLGITLGPSTGEALAESICRGASVSELLPFRLDR